MRQKIAAGAEFDFTTPGEMKEHLDGFVREFYQEKARGINPWRFKDAQAVASSAVELPAQGEEPFGPDLGYAVLVQAVRAQGLAGSDVLSVYRNNIEDDCFVAVLTVAAPVVKFSGRGLVLKGGEKLIFNGLSLTATGNVSVNGEGILCPEPDLYKLLSP